MYPDRRSLEAKAAIYARLSGGGGGGVREEDDEGEGEGEEPRYMVDFTRKIWEEVNNTMHCWRYMHVCTADDLCTYMYNNHLCGSDVGIGATNIYNFQ